MRLPIAFETNTRPEMRRAVDLTDEVPTILPVPDELTVSSSQPLDGT